MTFAATGLVHRSPEWYADRAHTVSATDVAAILGIANPKWASAFDLWWYKRSGADSQPDNAEMRRGHRLEELVLEDFREVHPEFLLTNVGHVRNAEQPWMACTPDAVAYESPASALDSPVAAVEAKTQNSRDGWGEEGTDEVPVYYRVQALWQQAVLGVTTTFIPVWFGTTYAEYVVTWDQTDVDLMVKASRDFLDSLAADEQPPIDDAYATTRRLKYLHPDVEDEEVVVPATLARQYETARRLRDAAEARMRLAENRVRHLLGNGRVAVTSEGRKVASRSVYDVAERTQTVHAFTVNKLTWSKPPREKKNSPSERN